MRILLSGGFPRISRDVKWKCAKTRERARARATREPSDSGNTPPCASIDSVETLRDVILLTANVTGVALENRTASLHIDRHMGRQCFAPLCARHFGVASVDNVENNRE